MPKRWINDPALVDSVAGSLMGAMAMFPKRMIHIDELVHQFGMPLSHISILILVAENDLSISQLSARMGIAKPNITPLVDTLKERGLVERVRGGHDRRIVQVHILPEGQAVVAQIRTAVAQQLTRWPGNISKANIQSLNQSLNSLIALMEQMDQQE